MKTGAEDGLPPIPEGEPYLTKAQLAKQLGKSERTIDNWRKQIALPCLKVENSVMFLLSEVQQHLAKTRPRPRRQPAPRLKLAQPRSDHAPSGV